MTDTSLDTLCVNTVRTLAMDAVQQANSGHPGTPMAMAPVAYAETLLDDTLAHGHLGTEETLLTILAHRHPELLQRRMLSDGLAGA